MGDIAIEFTINGRKWKGSVDEGTSLLELIRNKVGLTGTKEGCGVGECGACAVLVDDTPVNSCIFMAAWVNGRKVETVEGLAEKDGTLSPVQQAFVDNGAVQCGFCTPGFLISATAMLRSGQSYDEMEVRRELSGHLCRCTGYDKILAAVKEVLQKAGAFRQAEDNRIV